MAEIDVPGWYWVSMASGWVALGAVARYGPVWATIVTTVAFGAAHAAIAPWALSGRHASTSVSIRGGLVGPIG